ncbi:MAG: S4 domain-containing protein, partial [Ilumatobacteraceae bacterium]
MCSPGSTTMPRRIPDPTTTFERWRIGSSIADGPIVAIERRRLDSELVRRGLAASRTEASVLIESGQVLVDGAPAARSASRVAAGS